MGGCYTRIHKPVPFLVDQNPFSTTCSCGVPHLALRSQGGYLEVPTNALISLVLATNARKHSLSTAAQNTRRTKEVVYYSTG